MKKIIVILSLLICLAGAATLYVGFVFSSSLAQEIKPLSDRFTVIPGDTWIKVLNRLEREGYIADASKARRYIILKERLGTSIPLKKGTYEIKENMTLEDLVANILDQKVVMTKLVIPEGFNIYQIADHIELLKLGRKDRFLMLARDPAFAEKLVGIRVPSLEGFLFPDGYRFTETDGEETIIKRMVSRFFEVYNKEIKPIESETNLNFLQIVTLASVIEKETGAKEERSLIASVFHNRLRKGMRLQSDPTTIYGLMPNYNGNLRKADLLAHTPYNTYAISSLPVGPIANPSREALLAVIRPAESQYLYFVSKNDGTHVFSGTLKEHNAAVQTWQKNSQNRVGKSWRDLTKKGNESSSN